MPRDGHTDTTDKEAIHIELNEEGLSQILPAARVILSRIEQRVQQGLNSARLNVDEIRNDVDNLSTGSKPRLKKLYAKKITRQVDAFLNVRNNLEENIKSLKGLFNQDNVCDAQHIAATLDALEQLNKTVKSFSDGAKNAPERATDGAQKMPDSGDAKTGRLEKQFIQRIHNISLAAFSAQEYLLRATGTLNKLFDDARRAHPGTQTEQASQPLPGTKMTLSQ